MEKLSISDHFTIKKMVLFALPCIGMQLVDNTYQVVDGYFISNYLGEDVFAAENMIFPPLFLVLSLGFVMGAGGSAIISAHFGEEKEDKARETLTMLSIILFVLGIVLTVLAFLFMPVIARTVGATEDLVGYCSTYGRILTIFMPLQMLNFAFQEYLVAADEGRLGFVVSVVNAVTNIILDFFFVAILGLGLMGAATATGLAWCISFIVSFSYFLNKNHKLHFTAFKLNVKETVLAMINGSSEMVDTASYAIVAIIFNWRLMTLLGAGGVAAYAVTEYATGICAAVFMGFGIAMIPVIGYRYGEKNYSELKKYRSDGLKLVSIAGGLMMVLFLALGDIIAQLYIGYDPDISQMAAFALRSCAIAYIFVGINMFSSSFFTGISDGLASAMIAASRSFVLPIVFVFALPALFGNRSIWFTTLCAEILTVIVVFLLYLIRFKEDADGKN